MSLHNILYFHIKNIQIIVVIFAPNNTLLSELYNKPYLVGNHLQLVDGIQDNVAEISA